MLWKIDEFRFITKALIDSKAPVELLDYHLNERRASLFVHLSTAEKVDLSKLLFNTYGRSEEISKVLSTRYLAPYLLVQLIEKATFMKLKSLTVFSQCLENSTLFELEELSKLPEIEERFV